MSCTMFGWRSSASRTASRWKAREEHADSKNFLTATRVPPRSTSYTAPREPDPSHDAPLIMRMYSSRRSMSDAGIFSRDFSPASATGSLTLENVARAGSASSVPSSAPRTAGPPPAAVGVAGGDFSAAGDLVGDGGDRISCNCSSTCRHESASGGSASASAEEVELLERCRSIRVPTSESGLGVTASRRRRLTAREIAFGLP